MHHVPDMLLFGHHSKKVRADIEIVSVVVLAHFSDFEATKWSLWMMVRFRGIIEIRGVNPYVQVSAAIARRLKENWRKPLPVRARVNGRPRKRWHTNMMPTGDGSFYLYLHGAMRNASGTRVGDRVAVELSFDDHYRGGPTGTMPTWFRTALRKSSKAKKAWTALVPSRKKEILRYFAGLKSTQAKARNLRRAMEALSGGEVRFMARAWKGGK
jgi:hypothetical protein